MRNLSPVNYLNVAQIGCGYWGPNLLRVLTSTPPWDVKWVAEQSRERTEFVTTRYPNVRTTADFQDCLSDPDIDAVVISTPAGTHSDLVRSSLTAGKHVFVEKPLSMSVNDSEELVQLADQSGLVLMAGHTFIYNDALRELKRLLSSEELGDPYYFSSRRVNLGQVRQDINAWWNLAPHDVSIFLHLRDGMLPTSIQATGTDFVQPGIADVVFATMTWDDGVVGHVHVSWLDPLKAREVVVVGSKQMVVFDDMSEQKIAVYDKRVEAVPRIGDEMHFDIAEGYLINYVSGDVTHPDLEINEPLANELNHFAECIAGGLSPITGGQHAVDVTRILVAGDESLKSGESVEIDF